MDHARKMVLVPHEVMSRLEDRRDGPNDSALDAEMHRILNDKSIADESEKWKQYQQVLRRFLHVANVNRQPVTLPILEKEEAKTEIPALDYDLIVESLPLAYRNESRGLLRTLNRLGPDVVRWDANGTVYVNNERVPGSNIVDIAQSIVRARRTTHLPPGWTEVMSVLRDANVPSSYLGNPAAFEFLGRTPAATSPAAAVSAGLFGTPLTGRTRQPLFPTPPSSSRRIRSDRDRSDQPWESFY